MGCLCNLGLGLVFLFVCKAVAIVQTGLAAGLRGRRQTRWPSFPWSWHEQPSVEIVTGPDTNETRRPIKSITNEKSYRQTLVNIGDAQYVGAIHVGGQKLGAIFDTGSFELLAFTKNCTNCGTKSSLYTGAASSTHRGSSFMTEHSFGSGSTSSTWGYDTVRIGHFVVPDQGFWEVFDAQMPILQDGSFQAILGIGPPTSALKFAQLDDDDVHQELADYKNGGSSVTPQILSTVKHYDDLVTHARQSTGLVQHLGLENMSMCLGSATGSHGFMVWNDHATRDYPEKFTDVEVQGDFYWSAAMTDVQFSAPAHFFNVTGEKAEHLSRDRLLGCNESDRCTAVIDTGTTLIAAPKDAVSRIHQAMEEWFQMGGSCDDLSTLPDLEFHLGGQPFSLPPESYVGRLHGGFTEEIAKYLPSFLRNRMPRECEALIMAMEPDADEGPTWILGMPFFRKYYTSFHFKEKYGRRPQAASMSFSIAGENCEPGKKPEAPAKKSPENLIAGTLIPSSIPRRVEMNVDASKIRIPRFAGCKSGKCASKLR